MTPVVAYNLIIESISNIYSDNEAKNIAKYLLEDLFGYNYNSSEIIFNTASKIKLFDAIKDLKKSKPLQYITGRADFYGYQFYVNEDVLIPRPETEELVYKLLQDKSNEDNIKILDIGTGSGCIPITIKKKRPNWEVMAIDVSKKALKVAQQNANYYDVDIDFIDFDILEESQWDEIDKMDVIISNPPYIDIKEKSLIKKNVLDYEPHIALFVDDDDSLLFYKKIIAFGIKRLMSGGVMYFECNEFNSELLKIWVEQLSVFSSISIKQDLQGKDRMLIINRK